MKRWLSAIGVVLLAGIVAAAATFYYNPLWVNDEQIRNHLWRQGVRSEYVAVDGYRLHYFEAQPEHGEGIPLLLIHGLGSRGEDWSPLIPTLAAKGFHVYAPDLLGYGRSPRPDVDYGMALQVKTVVDFMHAAGIAHADVGGWSMGGWVAMKLTLDHPELVDRLVVFDSAGIYFPPTFDASLFTPNDMDGLVKLTTKLSPNPRPLPPFVVRAVVRRMGQNGWVIARGLQSMESGRDLLDFRLHLIQKPTLVVWGSEDHLIPLEVGESIHHKIPGSSMLVIEGCGHLAPGECSKPVLKGTIDFLKSDPPLQGQEQSLPGK